jgi:hypothetical protein
MSDVPSRISTSSMTSSPFFTSLRLTTEMSMAFGRLGAWVAKTPLDLVSGRA